VLAQVVKFMVTCKSVSSLCVAVTALIAIVGCSNNSTTPELSQSQLNPHVIVQKENNQFLSQKQFDPWILTTDDPNRIIDPYICIENKGCRIGANGAPVQTVMANDYVSGKIRAVKALLKAAPMSGDGYRQQLDMRTATVSTRMPHGGQAVITGTGPVNAQFWKTSDIAIGGDSEAQQVVHTSLFNLVETASACGDHSIPPMGLSSPVYDGHIFWDAEVWMFPALVAQHPDLARHILEYRLSRLPQATQLAKEHGYKGAEFPWESADTGLEQAPPEFATERHITADIAFAAWNYYLWTGNKSDLTSLVWPLLSSNAQYWCSRAKKGSDGSYHISEVMPPDENAGLVDDDAWTNGIVHETLLDAVACAKLVGHPADANWSNVAAKLVIPYNASLGMFMEYPKATESNFQAKQADTQMLIYPLRYSAAHNGGARIDIPVMQRTLDYWMKHTISVGPAMTASINSIDASLLGNADLALAQFRDSYRPFMRGPWAAFSEKRTTDNVYFCTGMGGCLQTVIYGFGGLNVSDDLHSGVGTKLVDDGGVSLYCDPHLPAGWTSLVLDGITFHGHRLNVTITPGKPPQVQGVN